jgi:hypothetical protein
MQEHAKATPDTAAFAEVQACTLRMQQMMSRQEALQQQNAALYGKLHELQEELTKRLDSFSTATLHELQEELTKTLNSFSTGTMLPPPPQHKDTASSTPQEEHLSPAQLTEAEHRSPTPADNCHGGGQHVTADLSRPPPVAVHGSGHHVSDTQHAGTPCSHQQGTGTSQPSRGMLALMHVAGHRPSVTKALPVTLPEPLLSLEASDARTVNSVMLEFLGAILKDAFHEPPPPSGVFMRFRFFNFPPTKTAAYRLEPLQVRPCTAFSSLRLLV